MKQIRLTAAMLAACALFASCDKDDESKPTPTYNNIGVVTSIVNPSGQNGNSYLTMIEDVSNELVTNKEAIPVGFGKVPFFHGQDVYCYPDWMGDSKNSITKYSRENGQLVMKGELPIPPQACATNIVVLNEEKAYLALQALGRIVVFNPKTMKQTGEIDLSEWGEGDTNPDPGSMLIRDGLLYIGLNQMKGGWMPEEARNYADVGIVDITTDKIVKKITEKTSGMSFATRPIDERSIFTDEKGDIYIACLGAFGTNPNHHSGFVRIKKGETDFDPSYNWVIDAITPAGEPGPVSWIEAVYYIGGGKACCYIHVPSYDGGDAVGHTGIASAPFLVDLYNRTITRLDIPVSSGWGMCLGKYKDLILYGGMSNEHKGFYSYNPATGQVSAMPILNTDGYPAAFYDFRQ